MRRLAPLLLLVVAVAAHAQPSAEAVVAAWQAGQVRAARAVDRVEADETLTRRLDGPRGTVRLQTRSTLGLGRGSQRTVLWARVDGEAVAPERVEALEGRLRRAFGPGFEDASRGPRLLPPLARATADGLTPDDLDGRPAWRVSLTLPQGHAPHRHRGGPPREPPPDAPRPAPDHAEAWFTRSADAPRLLRVDTAGPRPGGGVFRRTVDYVALGALDVPVSATADLRVTQRRRLRDYTTAIAVSARYDNLRIVRR